MQCFGGILQLIDFNIHLDFIRCSRRLCGGEDVTFCCDRKVPKSAQRGLKRVQVGTSPRRKSFLRERAAVSARLGCFSLHSGFQNTFAEKIALPEFFTPAGRSFSILPASRQRYAVFGLDFAAEEVQRAVLEVADFVALVGIPAVRAVVANLEAANLHRDSGKTQRHVAYGQETERLRFAISTKGECQHRCAACGVQAKVRDFHVAGEHWHSPYLLPLSYGIPSAFGARDLLLVSASTRSEMMYGSML